MLDQNNQFCMNCRFKLFMFACPFRCGTFIDFKVPKCEIFDRLDFPDFYTIKSLCEGDFGVKIKNFYKNI
jgi:hypothetical protein